MSLEVQHRKNAFFVKLDSGGSLLLRDRLCNTVVLVCVCVCVCARAQYIVLDGVENYRLTSY